MSITCQYVDANGELQIATVCAGETETGMVPAVTMCHQPELLVTIPTYGNECEVVALETDPIPPTPTPTGNVQKQLWFSSVIDFTVTGNTNIYRVPDDYALMIDTLEIVTLSITGAAIAPTVKFGTSADDDLFFGPTLSESNAANARHVAEIPQNLVSATTFVSGGVHTKSTATTHIGLFIFTGYLIELP
jgi:hypothetical protein